MSANAHPAGAEAWNNYRAGASGGNGSCVPRARLDWQGRRFLAATGAALKRGENEGIAPSVHNPVRVYVGMRHAASAIERARLALRELRSLIELPKRVLLIGAPTGTGYVNSAALAALEVLTQGGCASVAVQFGTRRSKSSVSALPASVDSVRDVIETIGPAVSDIASCVIVWAESFGAWSTLAALKGRPDLLQAFEVPSAVAWVGVPGPALADSDLRQILESRVPATRRAVEPRALHVEVAHPEMDPDSASASNDLLLVHEDDPVAHISGASLVARPQRHSLPVGSGGRRYAEHWRPLTTALRARAEVDAQTRPGGPHELRRPHDYRYAAVELVASLLGGQAAAPPSAMGEHRAVVESAEHWAYEHLRCLGPAPVQCDPWR